MHTNKTSKQQEVYLVNWKNQKGHVEIFDSLEVFVQSYPAYGLELLQEALGFGKTLFEDATVRIERKAVVRNPKPDFPRGLFWDFNYDKFNWQKGYVTVIQRIIERGNTADWQELIRFYGRDKIIESLKNEITFLPDEKIDEASVYFKLNKEELLCYIRKQSQPKLWL
jgi:hypothetical protein